MKTLMRARGALYGLAIGDALGMPTQMLSRPQIVARWGTLLAGFEPAPPGHPIAAGLPAGTVTDDTEQAILLGRLLVRGHGAVGTRELAQALVSWERDMAARGSLDLLGPSTKRAVAAVLAGVPPEEAGASGATNGAAMRIAPVGIAVNLDLPDPRRAVRPTLSILTDQVEAASRVTHHTGVALAGAAAVAAAVSAGVSGAGPGEATAFAVDAAGIAASRGHWVAGADVAARIEWATGLVTGLDSAAAADVISRWSAPAWPPRSRCRPRSRCWPRCRTIPGRRACWPPRWAATVTRSRPWRARWPEPAMASGRFRPTRSPSSTRRTSG